MSPCALRCNSEALAVQGTGCELTAHGWCLLHRPDTLDPALMRPGRLDRKIEIPLPNEQARMEILKIHASTITKHGDIDYEV